MFSVYRDSRRKSVLPHLNVVSESDHEAAVAYYLVADVFMFAEKRSKLAHVKILHQHLVESAVGVGPCGIVLRPFRHEGMPLAGRCGFSEEDSE